MTKARNLGVDANEVALSPRHTRTQRANLAGLDLDPEDDDEYNEGEDAEEFDESAVKDDDDMDADDDDVEVRTRVRRGRKRTAPTDDPDDEEEEEEGEEKGEDDAADKDTEGPEDETDAKEGSSKPDKDGKSGLPKKGKKRGRKPKIPRPEDLVFDDKGNEVDILNDEVVIEDEDPKGNEKIDEMGFLQGDRKFRIKTFTLLGKGDRQYMVSTEPARLVGFRDSYLLFKTHLSLFKKVCTHDEKMDLIQRHLIPTSYKGRSVNLVTARSIFREFGARMILGGKKVIDDFWEQKAIDRGDVSGEYADPEEAASSMRAASYGAGDGNAYTAQVTGSALINYQADPTWLYQISKQTLEFNTTLTEQRNQVWLRGIKDAYSGFNFYPSGSQPKKAVLVKVGNVEEDDMSVDCSIKFFNPDVRRKVTGLATIPKEFFDDIEDEDIKKAIVDQQKYERSVSKF